MLCYVIKTGKRLVNVISQLCESSPMRVIRKKGILKNEIS